MNTIFLETMPAGIAPLDPAIRLTITDSLSTRSSTLTNQNVSGGYELLGLNFFTNGFGTFTVGALMQDPDGLNSAIGTFTQLQVLENECYEVTWAKGANPPIDWTYAADPLGSTANDPGAFYYRVTLRSHRLSQFVPSLLAGDQTPVYVQTFLQTDTVPIDSSTTPCCVSEDSLIKTQRGWIEAGEIKSGDRVFTGPTDSIVVHKNIRFMIPSVDFIELPGQPKNLLIKANHPIFEDGQEILASNSKDCQIVKLSKPKKICTLITEKREFVDMSGIQVATWSESAFRNFIEHDKNGQNLRFESF